MVTKARPQSKHQSNGAAGKALLRRTTFRTSRQMDFLSERELATQIGHDADEWRLVIIKELIDNALDACEEHDIAPVIELTADATGIAIRDNGPGLPESTLKGALDLMVRVSSREAYQSPSRGAQGQALKGLVTMPRIIDPEHGRLIVTAHGKRHEIRCEADPISQRAVVHDDVTEARKSKNCKIKRNEKASFLTGTEVRVQWSAERRRFLWPCEPPESDARAQALVEGYSLFNPHATFILDWFGTRSRWQATDRSWAKWRPNQPTSSHWYEQRHLERQIGAYISHDREARRERLVSEFIAEFDGMSGSAKRAKVLDHAGLRRAKLSDLVEDDRLDSTRIAKLLAALQQNTRPVKARRLGIIGEAHLRKRLLALGIVPESFQYSRRLAKNGLPWIIESAFGWLGEDAKDARRIYTGVNFSPALAVAARQARRRQATRRRYDTVDIRARLFPKRPRFRGSFVAVSRQF
jgi:DNA topoisomerase VI subunit B